MAANSNIRIHEWGLSGDDQAGVMACHITGCGWSVSLDMPSLTDLLAALFDHTHDCKTGHN